jgi:hypothetical protein
MYHQLSLDLKLVIILLSLYGLYPNGTTWMAVENHLISWDCQSYKLDKEKAYSIMIDAELIEIIILSDGSSKYSITTEGIAFLEKHEIDIIGMRNEIHSIHDLRQKVIDVEHKVYA